MRLAWFHPGPLTHSLDASDAVDVAAELRTRHVIDQFNVGSAHDFVWQHAQSPYDLTLFELGDTAQYDFIWAYLFHYPGVVILRAPSLEHRRREALAIARRLEELRAERAFSHWDFLGAPVLASRLVVVHDATAALEVEGKLAGAHVRVVPVGVNAVRLSHASGGCRFLIAGNRADVALQAAARARDAGAPIDVFTDTTQIDDATVAVALEWPPTGAPPIAGLRAMAAGLPVIVFETEAVAAWPALDPQTWQPRGYRSDVVPVVVSIDPRDEEHSLMLAMRRLSSDAALRARLGDAARRWAREHASVRTAALAWDDVLSDAIVSRPVATAGVPRHLTADGTAVARAILEEMGVTVDFLE